MDGFLADRSEVVCVDANIYHSTVLRPALMHMPATIVVARNQDLVAGQRINQGQRSGDASESDITEHPHGVAFTNGGIPVVDQPTVHVIDINERALAVLDDVGMTEMKIGGKPRGHRDKRGTLQSDLRGVCLWRRL